MKLIIQVLKVQYVCHLGPQTILEVSYRSLNYFRVSHMHTLIALGKTFEDLDGTFHSLRTYVTPLK